MKEMLRHSSQNYDELALDYCAAGLTEEARAIWNIAISEGAAIAREIADITISEDDLYQLVVLRKISRGLTKRIDRNYRSIISFNMMLILLGVAGIIAPSTSALLHNMSTLAISVHSMTDVI